MRKVDLRLEFFPGRMDSLGGSTAPLPVLGVILPYALRFVHFDGAGVGLLFRDSDLQ